MVDRRLEHAGLRRRRLLALLVGCAGAAAQAQLGTWDRHAGLLAQRDRLVDDWGLLRAGGLALLLRHALAPGSSDPPGFRLGDCATQRNLDAAGRAQAMGAMLLAQAVPIARVWHSRWCRCRDTARLGFDDRVPVAEWSGLDSVFEYQALHRRQAALAWHARIEQEAVPGTNVVYVSHAANIDDAYGIWLREGEALLVRAAGTVAQALVAKLALAPKPV